MKKVFVGFVILFIIFFVIVGIFFIKDRITPKLYEDEKYDEVKEVPEVMEEIFKIIKIHVNGEELTVKLENNSSSEALFERLRDGNLSIEAHDYGNFEKVGDLGFSLPTNDTRITTKSGDLILYQGNQITLYYDVNTWTFTKLGEVVGKSQKELKDILGDGDVTLILSLE